MLSLLFLFCILAVPMAGLVLTPASQALARSRTSVAMACLLVWLLLFWSTALALTWPLLTNFAEIDPVSTESQTQSAPPALEAPATLILAPAQEGAQQAVTVDG